MKIIRRFATDIGTHCTVVLPGSCNARCSFCYDLDSQYDGVNYMSALKKAIESVPTSVKKLAITGRETTLSPFFKEVSMYLLELRERFDFIFLNSNGYRLEKNIQYLGAYDAINISRHHPLDTKNYTIFNTNTVPNKITLKRIASSISIPVNLNCVLTDDLDLQTLQKRVLEMVELCKYVGTSLTLRFEATDVLRQNELPVFLNQYPESQFSENPGYKVWLKEIDGIDVVVKYVTKDPTSNTDYLYGYIVHPKDDPKHTGKLLITKDWAGKKPI